MSPAKSNAKDKRVLLVDGGETLVDWRRFLRLHEAIAKLAESIVLEVFWFLQCVSLGRSLWAVDRTSKTKMQEVNMLILTVTHVLLNNLVE